jgi:hypothetical protein
MSERTLEERNSPQERLRLSRTEPAVVHFMAEGGWSVERGTAHRGVLTADEWRFLDRDALVADIEERLGFTLAELRSVYRSGRMSDAQRLLRARIDARLLELQRAGGNMSALARVLGWKCDARTRESWVMRRALARARAAA